MPSVGVVVSDGFRNQSDLVCCSYAIEPSAKPVVENADKAEIDAAEIAAPDWP
jgi:hypothetical protein